MLEISAALVSVHGGSPALYLDPGTGSILIQALIAALLAIGIFVRSQWSRIKKWFGVKPSAPADPEADDKDE